MAGDGWRSSAEQWNERYAAQDHLWTGRVNPTLVEVAGDLAPGSALNVGCGEGGDAVWLAERGWAVTGVDLSDVALARARSAAASRGVGERCHWVVGDISEPGWDGESGEAAGPYDLVASHYLHEPAEVRAAAWLAGAGALAPGGVLLLVGHHPEDEAPPGRGPRDRSVLFPPEEVASVLARLPDVVVETAEVRERALDAGRGPLVRRDTVVLARRTPVNSG